MRKYILQQVSAEAQSKENECNLAPKKKENQENAKMITNENAKMVYKFDKWENIEFDLTTARELAKNKKNGEDFMDVTVFMQHSFLGDKSCARINKRAPGN